MLWNSNASTICYVFRRCIFLFTRLGQFFSIKFVPWADDCNRSSPKSNLLLASKTFSHFWLFFFRVRRFGDLFENSKFFRLISETIINDNESSVKLSQFHSNAFLSSNEKWNENLSSSVGRLRLQFLVETTRCWRRRQQWRREQKNRWLITIGSRRQRWCWIRILWWFV